MFLKLIAKAAPDLLPGGIKIGDVEEAKIVATRRRIAITATKSGKTNGNIATNEMRAISPPLLLLVGALSRDPPPKNGNRNGGHTARIVNPIRRKRRIRNGNKTIARGSGIGIGTTKKARRNQTHENGGHALVGEAAIIAVKMSDPSNPGALPRHLRWSINPTVATRTSSSGNPTNRPLRDELDLGATTRINTGKRKPHPNRKPRSHTPHLFQNI